MTTGVGPLAGIRVIELGGLGPAPFGVMMLSDLGADVIRVDPPVLRTRQGQGNPINRGRRGLTLDLKNPDDLGRLTQLLGNADVLVDPFRPGTLERLGLDPTDLTERFPRLVIVRMSAWGQQGPLRDKASHDINVIAISGLLDTIGTERTGPVVPPMYLADFAGGGMVLAFGVVAALFERASSGLGQIVDASMLDGSNLLSVAIRGMLARGTWNPERGTNALDSGAHYYHVYRTADGGHLAVGAIEPKFYRQFLIGIGLSDEDLPDQNDSAAWPGLIRRIEAIIAGRTRREWEAIFAELDACVTPVLGIQESVDHPQMIARGSTVEVAGVLQPAAVPRFSRTPAGLPTPPPRPGEHTDQILGEPSGSTA